MGDAYDGEATAEKSARSHYYEEFRQSVIIAYWRRAGKSFRQRLLEAVIITATILVPRRQRVPPKISAHLRHGDAAKMRHHLSPLKCLCGGLAKTHSMPER